MVRGNKKYKSHLFWLPLPIMNEKKEIGNQRRVVWPGKLGDGVSGVTVCYVAKLAHSQAVNTDFINFTSYSSKDIQQ